MKFRLTNKPNRTLSPNCLRVVCCRCHQKMIRAAENKNLLYHCYNCECGRSWLVPKRATIVAKKICDGNCYYYGIGIVRIGADDSVKVLETRSVDVSSHIFVSDGIWNVTKVGDICEIR